jgi:two-component system, NtrC family, sensor histidine kinase HydH
MSALPQNQEQPGDQLSAEQLQAEIDRLRPLAEMGRMSATVAHEIRNPLAGISANAELLREVVTSGPDCECVDIILSEVERLGHLVSDLLYYSREREPELRPLDLPWLARSTVDLSMSEAERAGVELSVNGRGRVVGDADLSRQALLNVIRNAVQACRVGGRVSVTISDGQIAVSDTGGGVPEILKERLFEPFITGRTRGLGLGATVARRCQRRQGGDLRLLESSPKGSTFVLLWPSV